MKSLRYKIALGYATIILLNVVMVIFAIYHINQLSRPINRILSEKYRNVNAAENMKLALSQMERAQFEMIETGFDSTLYYNFQTYKNEFLNWHQRAIQGVALPEEPDILDSLMQAFQDYLSCSDSLQNMLGQGMAYRRVKAYHYRNIFPLVKKINALCTQLKEVNLKAINQSNLKAQEISKRTTSVILLFSLILMLFSVLTGIYFTKRILRPIRQTTETVRKIGQGHLEQKVEVESDDEMGQLALEFNRMTERLAAFERMNIEQIILEKKKSEGVIRNIPAAIIVTDAAGTVTLMNALARELFDLDEDGFRGKKITDLLKNETLAQMLEKGTWQPSEESSAMPKLIPFSRDGKQAYYEMRPIVISDDRGKIRSVIVLLQDVTRFKELDRLKSEFMATISHELKTPLTSINMTIDILLRKVKGELNPLQSELLHGAKQDVIRLKNFVAKLLIYSRLESGHYPLNLQAVNVRRLIDEAVRPFGQLFREKSVDFRAQIDPAADTLIGDFENLVWCISNLLQNAMEHVPQKGRIDLRVEKMNGSIRFAVRDNGPGIPLEGQKLIFEKFVRLGKFEESSEGNIGLGLAIVREIVHRHQGTIWVESAPGKGSTFYFEIPLNLNRGNHED